MKLASPIGLDAIEVQPLHEIVYNRLTRALMAGQIPPGRKLTSRKLAQELGTSDMPVRAALSRLQALKALVPLPNGSLILPPMTRDRFADLMATRQTCEAAATERAVEHVGQAELQAIQAAGIALVQAARDQDIDAYLEQNYEFKFRIYRASRSDALVFLIEVLWLQVGPFLRQFAGKFDGSLAGILALDHHHEVVDALARKDAPAAAAAIRLDLADGARFLLAHGTFA
jgi:DNA-binding GntR family transcriptional regulator